MQPDESVSLFEAKLRRSLMPVALSESATDSIHALLDELADADAAATEIAAVKSRTPWVATAAAVAGLLAVSAWMIPPSLEQLAFASADAGASVSWSPLSESSGMRLMDESTRLAWIEDEGWLADPDGGALHALRMGVIEENRLLDEETGIIVHISSPREEVLLTPVSTF